MASLKNAFAKSITTLNVKTNNFMEENKCKTYITTLEEEIVALKKQIGEMVFNLRDQDVDLKEKVTPLVTQIEEKINEINTQEERIAALAIEEQQILGTGQNNYTTTQPTENVVPPTASTNPSGDVQLANDIIYCSSCGTQNASNYKFCRKCGVALLK